jgi:ferric-dicitrate binding protein FerR (iron transport regulator)
MDDLNWRSLARYLADECSPEEAEAIESWLDADPARYRLMDELRRIWEASSESPGTAPEAMDVDVDADWEALSEELDSLDARSQASSSEERTRRSRPLRSRRSSRFRIAMSRRSLLLTLTALVVVVGSVWLGHRSATVSSDEGTGEVFQEIVTERGERTRIHFQDGTRIVLGVQSRLSIPDDFESGERVAHLDGEAYFEVASADRPFVVHTEEGRVEVFGTAFNVRSYESEEAMEVAVREGQVEVQSQDNDGPTSRVLLRARELGRLTEGRLTTQEGIDIESYLGWTEGRLVFDAQPLPEVATELERWYDVEVVLDDPSLRSLRLTANIGRQSLSEVLRVIAVSLDLEYEIEGAVVTLTR